MEIVIIKYTLRIKVDKILVFYNVLVLILFSKYNKYLFSFSWYYIFFNKKIGQEKSYICSKKIYSKNKEKNKIQPKSFEKNKSKLENNRYKYIKPNKKILFLRFFEVLVKKLKENHL